jgi:ribosomal protein S18 acetylase RimI-like enzyme
MSPTPPQYSLRKAEIKDRALLTRFLNSPAYSHRHLDWRDPLDWLGNQPFWILEKNYEVEAVFACPPDPIDVAWVRIFAVASRASPSWSWNILFERALNDLLERNPRPTLVSLSLQDWFGDLLVVNHFHHHQDIIVLSFEGAIPPVLPSEPGMVVRPMQSEDISEVTVIDNLAFEPIWRLSQDDLQRAFQRSSYKTVIELDGKVIGYQMSALNGFNAHLARLAVHPGIQRRRMGYRLVQNMLQHFITGHGTWGVTLNTQDNNSASLSLYKYIGFHLTGERFPVYVYQPPSD